MLLILVIADLALSDFYWLFDTFSANTLCNKIYMYKLVHILYIVFTSSLFEDEISHIRPQPVQPEEPPLPQPSTAAIASMLYVCFLLARQVEGRSVDTGPNTWTHIHMHHCTCTLIQFSRIKPFLYLHVSCYVHYICRRL